MKQAGTSFGKKTAQKLDLIENNPLAVIVTLLTIYQELIPSIIDVVPITPWELFKILCTGPAVAEFNDIFFKASGGVSSSSKHISKRRYASCMKTLKKSRPGKKNYKSKL